MPTKMNCHKKHSREVPKSYKILLKDIGMVKVFIMSVKHQRQGHKVKSVGTYRKVLSEEAHM
jgi:hypothetical protein